MNRTKPKAGFESSPVEIYPNLPEHKNEYIADVERDKTEDASCSKAYNSKVDITGGLTHISCEHNGVKGFTTALKVPPYKQNVPYGLSTPLLSSI